MKKGFLITAALLLIPAAAFFGGGLTEEEQGICEQRARIERNEFSAKQTYERCKKSIRAELQ